MRIKDSGFCISIYVYKKKKKINYYHIFYFFLQQNFQNQNEAFVCCLSYKKIHLRKKQKKKISIAVLSTRWRQGPRFILGKHAHAHARTDPPNSTVIFEHCYVTIGNV